MKQLKKSRNKVIVALLIISALSINWLSVNVYGDTTIESLTDVKESDWYYATLDEIVSKGIITGYPDNTFRPQNNITRAEFTKILLNSLNISINESSETFIDTAGHWAEDIIYTAWEKEIIRKTDFGAEEYDNNESYNPDKEITRIEMSRMVVRALGLDADAKVKTGETTEFNDDDVIKNEDKGYVILASNYGIVKGYTDKTFKPNGQATRAEAAQMLLNMLNAVGVSEVQADEDITDAERLDSTPIEDTEYEYLKNYKNTDLRGNVTYEVDGIIKADTSLFPIKFGNIVITGMDKVRAKDAPYYGDTSLGWRGSDNKDAIALHAYAIDCNDSNKHSANYFWAQSLEILFVNKSGETFNKPIMRVSTDDTIYNGTDRLYSDYAFGEYPKVSLNKDFTVMFIAKDGFNIEDLDKVIILDTMNSTRDGLELDADRID